jgi:chaperonin GroES
LVLVRYKIFNFHIGAKMELVPLFDRIVVEPTVASQTESGLFLPDTATQAVQTGTVLVVGQGKWGADRQAGVEVKVGDTLLFTRHSGNEVKMNGKTVRIIRSEDVVALVK